MGTGFLYPGRDAVGTGSRFLYGGSADPPGQKAALWKAPGGVPPGDLWGRGAAAVLFVQTSRIPDHGVHGDPGDLEAGSPEQGLCDRKRADVHSLWRAFASVHETGADHLLYPAPVLYAFRLSGIRPVHDGTGALSGGRRADERHRRKPGVSAVPSAVGDPDPVA